MCLFEKITSATLLLAICCIGKYSFAGLNNNVLDAFEKSDVHHSESDFNIDFSDFNSFDDSIQGSEEYYLYFSEKKRKKTIALFNWKNSKTSFVNQIISENNIPKKFSVLPILLSGGNSIYKNNNGGVGIWGLQYPVAKKYGLLLNQYIDERCIDSLSCVAAAEHLKHLLSIYKQNVDLAFLAYISSPSLVNKAILRSNKDSIDSIVIQMGGDYQDWLNAFRALSALNNQIPISKDEFNNQRQLVSFSVKEPLLFEAIDHCMDFKLKRFQTLNPQIRKNKIPKDYPIILDSGECNQLLKHLDSIYFFQDSVLLNPFFNEAFELTKMLVYKVKSGDYLGKIAELYEVKVSELQSWNELNGTRINIGQELVIYTPDSDTTKYFVYRIKEGDSMASIAKKFPGITVDSLKKLNPDTSIKTGQLLKLKKK